VGCSFCAFDPSRLQAWFAYTDPNRDLWRDLLATSWELFGPGCRAATCYHATEPTDNPDYLHFLEDFHRIIGNLPQTTTARPLKDVEWTRALLSMRAACDPEGVDRFSVLGTRALHRLHKAFTPEELRDVLLVIHKPGMREKAFSGRIMAQADAVIEGLQARVPANSGPTLLPPQMTIECVCGYLVNLVDRSIKLISPCNASQRWPLGYQVHAEGTFRNAAEFKGFILNSIDECMPAHLGPHDRVALRPGLQYERHEDGFSLVGRYRRHQLRGDPQLVALGDLLRQGDSTPGEVTEAFVGAGNPLFGLLAVSWLDKLYQSGLLAEPT
jgi:radical SAM family RiPP maturation amino acid epimerase